MESNEVTSHMLTQRTRRSVLGQGAKLAYAAPVVAASFKLTASGSLAAVCPPGFTDIPNGEAGRECCICDCTTADVVLDPEKLTCTSPVFGDVTKICLECVGKVQSLPRTR